MLSATNFFPIPGRRDLLATRQHPRPSRSSSFQAFEAICGCLQVMCLAFDFVFFLRITFLENSFRVFFPRKGREFTTCANLSTVCYVLSLFSAPCDKFGKKAYTELSWLDVMSSVWTMLTQQITPFHVLSIFNNPAIQFTLNPSYYPKKYPTTFSPPMSKRLH